MKAYTIFGLSVFTLCALAGPAAFGQTTFGWTPPSPGSGPAQASAGGLSRRFVFPSDKDWQVTSVHVGTTRAQVERFFAGAGGYSALSPGEWVYSLRQDPNVHLRVRYDNTDRAAPRPTDRVIKTYKAYRQRAAYD